MWKNIDIIIDGGVLSDSEEARAGSTVIDLTVKNTYKIIRNGSHYDTVVKLLNDECKLERRE
jgi:hypothetical protein